jgi:NAD(P)-dependent dehydrogenase (short-subunit alcohol dehydrogenase family)
MGLFPSPTKIWHTSSYHTISPSRPELSLAGKSVVITGGSAGIGLAISQAFALAGVSQIAILGRRTDVLAKAAASIHDLVGTKTQVFTVPADVASKDQMDSALAEIKTVFGGKPLDILVSNAGYYSGVRPFGTETPSEWQAAVEANIIGVYNTTTAFIANATSDATIINTASGAAHLPTPFHGFSAYTSTKMAGARLMECLQSEMPSLHIVNLHPGQVVETDMAKKLAADLKVDREHIDDSIAPNVYLRRCADTI